MRTYILDNVGKYRNMFLSTKGFLGFLNFRPGMATMPRGIVIANMRVQSPVWGGPCSVLGD